MIVVAKERVVKMTIEAVSAGTALVDFMPYCKYYSLFDDDNMLTRGSSQ